jgi:hypothetical protein
MNTNNTPDITDYGYGISELILTPSVSAILNILDQGMGIFDDDNTTTIPLPGENSEKYRGYVPWGDDNQRPFQVMGKIKKDEVLSQNKLFNTLTGYASGIRIRRDDGTKINDPEQKNFFKYNRMPRYLLEQVTDFKHFFFSVSVIILSRDGKKIVQLRHKEAAYVRFETCNPENGQIEHLFYADWEDTITGKIEIIPVLDISNPLGDLETRMGRIPDREGKVRKPVKERVFAIINQFPVPGCKYYPFAPFWSVFLSGWYDIKQMIPGGKKAKFRNHAQIKYQVEVHRDYWQNICHEEKITDPEEKAARIKKEKENIRDFLTGIENSGKLWITGYYTDPTGKETRMVRINLVDQGKEGGDWITDSEEASNMLCYADNIHPNLVGATPGKNHGGFSGSVQRELFTMKQALEKPYHDILLEPLFLIKEYNGWEDILIDIPVITLTTLDKGKDAEENTLRKEGNI